ncbi:dihydrofolate reductase family protein [Micromonospora sp. WMMD1102]|uniref:dihydrofolate reductase family protein n=1 Tax=Micromonospora sp. WMMD1102 TaxID=3016105 RepID=UPI002414D8C1|nr:dihydrofolate reductase family protein [Micromonospora sp. WMMD1102]MDG4791433.1 dihydrofolate reductase family protein [Micromonospora sp. WMMD1102]
MKVTLTQFVTLDGVSQGPGSPAEDPSDGFTRGGWLVPHLDELFVRRTSQWMDLADGLLLAGLVDTLRLVVAPTATGAGRRLLDQPGTAVGFRLVRSEATATGLLLLEYEPGTAAVAEYQGVGAFV